jgi:tetratricopeptide (TPR) repeat protein
MHRARDFWICSAVLLFVLLAYLGALRVPFVWDDHRLIERHALEREWRSVPGLFAQNYWSVPGDTSAHSFYRPLTASSFVVDAAIWGGRPSGFHATNLIAHLLVCALVFVTARRCGARPEWAFLAAAFFGVFPRLTESVTWISGRTDVLATLFGLAAFFVQIHPRTRDLPGRRLLAGLFLLAGLLCKEVAIAAFFAIAAFEWRRVGGVQDGPRPLVQSLLPATLSCVLYLALRGSATTALHASVDLSLATRLLSAVQSIGEYVRMLVTPFEPELFVGSVGVIEPSMLTLGILATPIIGVSVVLFLRRVSDPRALGLVMLGLIPIGLVMHMIPIAQTVVAADRFLYAPVLALTLLGAMMAPDWRSPGGRAALAVVASLCLAFAIAVHLRNRVWQDEVALWNVTREQADDVLGQVENEYAAALSRSGRSEEALAAHRRAYDLQRRYQGRHPGAHVNRQIGLNLALALSEHGFFEDALPLLEAEFERRPDHPAVLLNYGTALSRSSQFRRADEILSRVPASSADVALARMLLRQNARAASIWQRLPPPSRDEAISIKAERAYVYHLVGRVKLADELFVEVIRSPGVTPAMLKRATDVLEQQQRVIPDSPHTRSLEQALREEHRSVALESGPVVAAGTSSLPSSSLPR